MLTYVQGLWPLSSVLILSSCIINEFKYIMTDDRNKTKNYVVKMEVFFNGKNHEDL